MFVKTYRAPDIPLLLKVKQKVKVSEINPSNKIDGGTYESKAPDWMQQFQAKHWRYIERQTSVTQISLNLSATVAFLDNALKINMLVKFVFVLEADGVNVVNGCWYM